MCQSTRSKTVRIAEWQVIDLTIKQESAFVRETGDLGTVSKMVLIIQVASNSIQARSTSLAAANKLAPRAELSTCSPRCLVARVSGVVCE